VTQSTGARFLARALADSGVACAFLVPTILSRTLVEMDLVVGIRRVLAHSEKAAAYMADGYARASGRVGLCLAQAIGASNLASGLRDARLAHSPVLALTGGPTSSGKTRSVYQQLADRDQFRAVAKFSERIERIADLPGALAAALRAATGPSPGPAHLEFAGHMGELEAEEADFPAFDFARLRAQAPWRIRPDDAALQAAHEAILTAKRPILVAGGGVVWSGARDAVRGFCAAAGMPYATALNALEISAGDDANVHVGVPGLYSRKSANDAVLEADLVIFVGSATGSQATAAWNVPRSGTRTIEINIDPAELSRHYPNSIALSGDARTTLDALRARLAAQPIDPVRFAEWRARCRHLIDEWRAETETARASSAAPIRPERLVTEMSRVLPSNALTVVDTGHAGMWAATYLDLRHADQRFIRAAGSLGWSLPAAIGAKIGAPERPVLCFTGDGGLWYHIGEIETAVRCGAELVVVVNNNVCMNQERDVYKTAYGGELRGRHAELWHYTDADLCGMARAMGAKATRVDRAADVAPAIEGALRGGGVHLVDVRSDPDAMAPHAYIGDGKYLGFGLPAR
jgi:acetolactate synthase I/II/III large subunit